LTLTNRAGTSIYLVHHGNTRLDEQDKTHGNLDESLSTRGRAEVHKTA
jgi:broad specificity phosphatase PhoE